MSVGNGQRVRAVASLVPPVSYRPSPVPTFAVVESDWDDDDSVDYQDASQDDTVNVAAETLEAPSATGKRGMAETERPNGGNGSAGGTAEEAAELAVMIRVAGNGAVVTNQRGSEELAGVVAYTHRLVELVGDMLGLERFVAMECVFKGPPAKANGQATAQERCLLFAEANGDAVLVRPRSEGDLRALRESLGL